MLRYTCKTLVGQLRAGVLKRINASIASSRCSPWCCLAVIRSEMSRVNQVEVAMEFLFTGASSVTTSLVWLYHIAASGERFKAQLAEEARSKLQWMG